MSMAFHYRGEAFTLVSLSLSYFSCMRKEKVAPSLAHKRGWFRMNNAEQRERLTGRSVMLCLAVFIAVPLCPNVAHPQSVAFINPGRSDEIYWVTATQAMQAAARSL